MISGGGRLKFHFELVTSLAVPEGKKNFFLGVLRHALSDGLIKKGGQDFHEKTLSKFVHLETAITGSERVEATNRRSSFSAHFM